MKISIATNYFQQKWERTDVTFAPNAWNIKSKFKFSGNEFDEDLFSGNGKWQRTFFSEKFHRGPFFLVPTDLLTNRFDRIHFYFYNTVIITFWLKSYHGNSFLRENIFPVLRSSCSINTLNDEKIAIHAYGKDWKFIQKPKLWMKME